jgi:ferrochelatase
MSSYKGSPDFEHGMPAKIGILVCNLGTPDTPTPKAVRRYLAEFLSDPRVVELPRVLWLPILHGVILRVRPRRSAAAYAKIWSADGSPLLAITKRQGIAIATAMEERFPGSTEVVVGMRYGSPSIAAGLRQLRESNVQKILVLPLYPQYATATTASAMDAVSAELNRWRRVPSLRFIADYHADANYIEALATSVSTFWAANDRADHLLMSFHGTPRDTFLAGDPYHGHCQTTARLLSERLALEDGRWGLAFQSRVGPKDWLQPYTESALKQLAADGAKTVDVLCPGFAADCLETLEEIAIRYAEMFVAAGGERLRYIPALNDTEQHIDALVHLIQRNLDGWDKSDPSWNGAAEPANPAGS